MIIFISTWLTPFVHSLHGNSHGCECSCVIWFLQMCEKHLEAFVEWPTRRVTMTKNSGSKRQRSPRTIQDTSDTDDGSAWQVRERRTKHRQDLQPDSSGKGKQKVQDVRSTSTKRTRELQVQQDFRRGYETPEEDAEEDEEQEDADTDNADVSEEEAPTQTPAKLEGIRPCLKKPLQVDEDGAPYGPLRKALEAEVRLLTKDLDPSPNFKEQEEALRERYLKRLFEGWQVKGVHPNQHAEVDEGWIAMRTNKTLTNQRFRYKKMIDKREPKPSHISNKHWNKMVKIRKTQAAK